MATIHESLKSILTATDTKFKSDVKGILGDGTEAEPVELDSIKAFELQQATALMALATGAVSSTEKSNNDAAQGAVQKI